MYLIRPASNAARNPLIRSISSLCAGNILQGAYWDYRILNLVEGDNTHISTVFKAEVIPHEHPRSAPKAPQWAFIKGALPDDAIAVKNLNRELHAYSLPGVASSQCFRKLYDVIDDSTIALEWLDTTLAEVKYQPNDIGTHSLIVSVLRAALNSCAVLAGSRYVNTDYKPANILLSGVESDCITAKVGDLGLVVPVGELINAQPYAMRAPEVFLGQPCAEPSQVWAVAAMLLCWIKPGVLGIWGSTHFLLNVPWSMAKVKRLFPDWKIPTPDEVDGDFLKVSVSIAKSLGENMPELQALLPFDQETQNIEMPNQLRDLLRFMLIPNPAERPSASSVLASKELRGLENLTSEYVH
ncbi:uncharacterized protein N7500_007881 [Penicillium coprophilum]|uniref:uncharacterized protein n=1 Tax=Penicillium coprophilum TaxID=36646 RepID=UPI0023892845|nr:uncharacterized protein N7500_007881 [Penicillium coprophilum]KAJ5158230.1 hypothetical protein N7500_007881 [Penicillium coprophilum]